MDSNCISMVHNANSQLRYENLRVTEPGGYLYINILITVCESKMQSRATINWRGASCVPLSVSLPRLQYDCMQNVRYY